MALVAAACALAASRPLAAQAPGVPAAPAPVPPVPVPTGPIPMEPGPAAPAPTLPPSSPLPTAAPNGAPAPAGPPAVVPLAASALGPFAAYRPPVLGLVQPAPGAPVPADRPVVGLRFVAGEPGDPLDPASFTLTVDGRDRSAAFQVTAVAAGVSGAPALGNPASGPTVGEAWGALADGEGGGRAALKAGAHRVRARVCSARGVCASLDATVTAVADPAAGAPGGAAASRPRRILGALLDLGRRLLLP